VHKVCYKKLFFLTFSFYSINLFSEKKSLLISAAADCSTFYFDDFSSGSLSVVFYGELLLKKAFGLHGWSKI
jgi:hypothetical protein